MPLEQYVKSLTQRAFDEQMRFAPPPRETWIDAQRRIATIRRTDLLRDAVCALAINDHLDGNVVRALIDIDEWLGALDTLELAWTLRDGCAAAE